MYEFTFVCVTNILHTSTELTLLCSGEFGWSECTRGKVMVTLIRVHLTPMAVSWRETRFSCVGLQVYNNGGGVWEKMGKRTDCLVPHSKLTMLACTIFLNIICETLYWGKDILY